MLLKVGRTARAYERRATIRMIETVRTSPRSPIDTVRVCFEPIDGPSDAKSVWVTFDLDAINLDSTLARNVDDLIEALTKLRNGDRDGTLADIGRDRDLVGAPARRGSQGPPARAAADGAVVVKVTVDTITDEQIRELHNSALEGTAADAHRRHLCHVALAECCVATRGPMSHRYPGADEIAEARTWLAEFWNASHGGES